MLVAAEVVPAFVLGFEEHRLQSARMASRWARSESVSMQIAGFRLRRCGNRLTRTFGWRRLSTCHAAQEGCAALGAAVGCDGRTGSLDAGRYPP